MLFVFVCFVLFFCFALNSFKISLGSWFFPEPRPLLPSTAASSFCPHNHLTEREQAHFTPLQRQQFRNCPRRSLSLSYFNDLFTYFFFQTFQTSSQDPGDGSEREARTERLVEAILKTSHILLEATEPMFFFPWKLISHHELPTFSENRVKCLATFSPTLRKMVLTFPSD